MDSSPAVETRIQQEVKALERCFDRITSCRVVVEAPHKHHQRGNEFHVSIDLHVPGSQIIVNHDPSAHSTAVGIQANAWDKSLETQPDHKDVYVSIRDAFAAARRQLQGYAQKLRGETSKRHLSLAGA